MQKYISTIILLVVVSISAHSQANMQGIDSTNYHFYKKVQSQLTSGNRALNFNYLNEKGEEVSLESLKGKVVYLDFWASYCSYCVSQIPEITAFQKKYPEVAVIRISVDEREQAWKGASARYDIDGYNLWAGGMTYPADKYTLDLFYFDANERNKTPASFELSNPIPGYVLIDQKGRIIDNRAPEPGTEDLDKLINQLLK
jgi:thiol-disulfide isomerase/thioredoxin